MPLAAHGPLKAWLATDSDPASAHLGDRTQGPAIQHVGLSSSSTSTRCIAGRCHAASFFHALQSSGGDFFSTAARPRRLRTHTEFLQAGNVETMEPNAQHKSLASVFMSKDPGQGDKSKASLLSSSMPSMGGAKEVESEADQAMKRGEVASAVSLEAKETAEAAEEADESLENVEYAILWLNFALTGVLFAGIYVAHTSYKKWLGLKMELGRSWVAVQRAGLIGSAPGGESAATVGTAARQSRMHAGHSGGFAGEPLPPPTLADEQIELAEINPGVANVARSTSAAPSIAEECEDY